MRDIVAKGCYTLVISLRKKRTILVGKMGRVCFPPGTYLYTGSAMNSLRGRLSRHLRRGNKRNHWHIDYFLQCPGAALKRVLVYPAPILQECYLNQRITTLRGAKVIVQGFGASDCSAGCGSHLLHFAKKDSAGLMTRLLRAQRL